MFARPTKEAAPREGVDGRPTFMTSGGRAAPADRLFGASAVGSSSSQVEFALEQILLRKFGGTPKQNEVVKRELADVLSAGPMTEERMKELQLRLADLLIAAGSKRASETARHVLSATMTRSSAPRQPLASPMRAPAAAAPAPAAVKPAAGPSRHDATSSAPFRSVADTVRPALHTGGDSGAAGASTGGGGLSALMSSGVGGMGAGADGRRSPDLRRLRSQMLSDPEPEKVLGLVAQTALKLELEEKKAKKKAEAAAWRADLAAEVAEKAAREKRERELEQYWKGVVQSNVADSAERERQEAAEAKQREAEQKAAREEQMRAREASQALATAKLRAQEQYELSLVRKEADLRRQEAAEELRKKQERAQTQLAENAALREAHRSAKEQARLDEQRAMEEYNRMVEQQERAHKEAIATVFARQDTLVAMANTKAADDERRALEEKERTLHAFEAAKRALAEQERAREAARKESQRKWRDELTGQVQAHSARTEAERAQERAIGDQLAAESRAATEELARRHATANATKELYRKLLEEQVAAKKQLELLKKQREHHIVAEQLDSLDGDDRMMAEIAKLLKDRAAGLEAAKRAMDEQNAMLDRFMSQAPVTARGIKK